MNKTYKTIIISDLHLGNPYSNWKLLKKFLEENTCENLFLNGDIVDNHYLLENKKSLSEEELEFLMWMVNKLSLTKVIYIVGNHELYDITEEKIWKFNLTLHPFYIYESNSKKYFISHGHNTIFKNPITQIKIILRLIDFTIRFLSKFQKNHKGIIFQKGEFNINKGEEFINLSDKSRNFFKIGLKIISLYLYRIKKYKTRYNCNTVICGHIHHPEVKKDYLNSGDWIENNSLIVEDFNGNWKIIKN